MKLRNSRTLPRHWRDPSSAAASRPSVRAGSPSRAARRRKWRASGSISPARSRSRRQADGEHVDAVVQILAEPALGDQRRQVTIGGGNDPHVEGNLVLPAHAADAARLQRTQQAGLRVCRHVADLVEEQRAAMRLLELAGCCAPPAPVKAPFSCPNSSLSTSSRGIAAVFTATNGPVLARAELMNRFGYQLLAGARFAQDQDGEIVAQHARDHPVDILHRRAAADQRQSVGRLVGLDDLAPALPVCRLARGADQFVEIERFGKIFESARLARPDSGVERVLRREDDDRQFGICPRDLAQGGNAVAVEEDHIGQQHVVVALRQQPVALGDTVAALDGEGFLLEPGRDDRGDGAVILHQQRTPGHAS